MINIHTHIFNGKYTPEYFLLDGTKGNKFAAKNLRKLLNGNWLAQQTPLALVKAMTGGSASKMIAFVRMGIRKEMEEIFHVMANESGYPENTRFVVLPLNFEHMGGGACDIPYTEQLKDTLYKVKSHHPNTCLPFVHIDPRMETTNETLAEFATHYLKRGFVGLKLYPSLGYYPYDEGLKPIYEFAQKEQLPIMTHCSRGGIYYLDTLPPHFYAGVSFNPTAPCLLPYNNATPQNPIKEPKYIYPQSVTKNSDFCDFFLDPENYVDALSLFPDLKICFAHFGSDDEIKKKMQTPPRTDTWYDKVIKLLHTYKKTYADISYTLHMPEFRKLVLQDMESELSANPGAAVGSRLVDRVLYGTDFYMPYQEDKCTEESLFTDAFRDFNDLSAYPTLAALGQGVLWRMITKDNCERYLTSTFYKASF